MQEHYVCGTGRLLFCAIVPLCLNAHCTIGLQMLTEGSHIVFE